jgi:hypothetical protein
MKRVPHQAPQHFSAELAADPPWDSNMQAIPRHVKAFSTRQAAGIRNARQSKLPGGHKNRPAEAVYS